MTVAIVGVGEPTPAWKDDRPTLGLVVEAVRRALDDAGIDGADVDGFTSEAQTMLTRVRPDEVARAIGARDRRFSSHSSIAGSGVLGAIEQAVLALEAGLADVVVSYYGLSLSRSTPYSIHAEDPAKAAFEMPFGYFGQPVYFAMLGVAVPPRVRPARAGPRCRPDRRSRLGPADARRPRARPARSRRLPGRSRRRRPVAQARLLPRQRRRGRRRADPRRPGRATPPSLRSSSPGPGSARSR